MNGTTSAVSRPKSDHMAKKGIMITIRRQESSKSGSLRLSSHSFIKDPVRMFQSNANAAAAVLLGCNVSVVKRPIFRSVNDAKSHKSP